MLKVFIDTDIILDLFAKREPYYNHAAKLFTLIDHQKIIAYTSPIIIANLNYILSRLISRNKATQALQKLKTLVKILSVDEKVIELALHSDFKDFEDLIQYQTAKLNAIKFLITSHSRETIHPNHNNLIGGYLKRINDIRTIFNKFYGCLEQNKDYLVGLEEKLENVKKAVLDEEFVDRISKTKTENLETTANDPKKSYPDWKNFVRIGDVKKIPPVEHV